LTQKHEDSLAEHQQRSHHRALLNHFRLPILRSSGTLDQHDPGNHGTKRLRPLGLAAIILLSIVILSLHAIGGVVLLKIGPGAFSWRSPIADLLIGFVFIIALFKLKYVVSFLRRRKR
jgi:hypothetical protein